MSDPSAPTIGVLGDVMLGRAVGDQLAAEPESGWSEELLELTRACDLVVANLECCLSERGRPTALIAGKPFFFRGPPQMVRALTALGNVAVGLANNHALDFGPEALIDTLRILEAAGVSSAGAGDDVARARRGSVVPVADGVGLLAVSDHPAEFAASAQRPGIAYADLATGIPNWIADELRRLRGECRRVIAFAHWGPNMTTGPAPWQRRVAAELHELGADLVAGHSAHVFHGVGWSERGPLVYDLGDALDDYAIDPRLRNDLGVLALWRPDAEPELELVGLELRYCRTELARGAEADWIAARLHDASSPLGTAVERLGEQRFAVTSLRG
jgi:poly-gamma-glutamate capsule biosynthesis protein CapA/YwtB (metallophosphatase superfamily)